MMKQQEAEQMINDVRCQFRSATCTLDLARLRRNGNGCRVVIRWSGRRVVIGKSGEWASLRLAWQVLNERE